MAIGLIAGAAIYSAAAGTVVAGVTITAAGAAALAVAGGVAVAYAANAAMDAIGSMGGGGTEIVQLGAEAQPIDKTRMQEEAEQKPLKLGDDDEADKRRKGKAAYKIELDKDAAGAVAPPPETGAQVAAVTPGVQL